MATADPFAQVRAHCLALPGVAERLSHGAPTFFTKDGKGPSFVMCHDDHHGDGIVGLWLAAPAGAQEAAVADDPDSYFRPPYVGHRGWLGVRLDRDLPWPEVAGRLDEAYASVKR